MSDPRKQCEISFLHFQVDDKRTSQCYFDSLSMLHCVCTFVTLRDFLNHEQYSHECGKSDVKI